MVKQPLSGRTKQPRLPNIFPSYGLIAVLVMAMASQVDAGVALRLYYNKIPGDEVSSLRNHGSFPGRPSSHEPVTDLLEASSSRGDNYGTWTRGYIEAPQTGKYIFWIASDNDSEFWLSSDFTSEKLLKMAENIGVVRTRDFEAKPAQRSEPVELQKGERYYFELLHKEGVGGDHVSVGWQLPDGSMERPIPATRLMPFPVNTAHQPEEKAPVILTEYFGQTVTQLTNVSVVQGETATFSVTAEATQPCSFQWFRNRQLIPGAVLSSLTLTNVQLSEDVDLFTVVVSNALGKASAEAVLSVLSASPPPTVLSALNLGVSNSVAVIFSRSVTVKTATDIHNFSIDNGVIVRAAKMGPSSQTVLLNTSQLVPGLPYRLKIKGVEAEAKDRPVIESGSMVTIEEGLKIWIRFDELLSTNRSTDSAGTELAAFVGEPVLSPDGKREAALVFDGKDDHGKWPDGFEDFTSGMTIAVWAKPTATKNWARFIDLGNGSASDNILFGRMHQSTDLFFETYHGKLSAGQAIARGALELNQWQHLAATMDSTGKVLLYKNGVLAAENNLGLPHVLLRTENFVGRSNWAHDSFYEGAMDDLRIYNRALSAAEIQALSSGIVDGK